MKIFETMHIFDSTEQLDHYIYHYILSHFTSVDKTEQISSLAKLCHNIDILVIIVDVIKLDNVRVIHLLQDLELVH